MIPLHVLAVAPQLLHRGRRHTVVEDLNVDNDALVFVFVLVAVVAAEFFNHFLHRHLLSQLGELSGSGSFGSHVSSGSSG